MLEPLRQGLLPNDPATASHTASRALTARYEAVRAAREFTRRTLGDWHLDEHFDDIALVVSELVTNALRHGLPANTPRAADGDDAAAAPVRLHLMRWPTHFVCAVRDPSERSPVVRQDVVRQDKALDGCAELADLPELAGIAAFADCSAESGRGLFLVDSFSDSWGWHPLAGTLTGKVVWALFRLRPAP
ncbi:ATP-binding protein [Streptomyces sp. NPDC002851]